MTLIEEIRIRIKRLRNTRSRRMKRIRKKNINKDLDKSDISLKSDS
jgi:hypothetical protein